MIAATQPTHLAAQPWPTLPDDLLPGAREVCVIAASLDVSDQRLGELRSTLSPDELQRATQFHFLRDQRRFITGRGLLREILGRFLQRSPGRLAFSYNAHGKPQLHEPARLLQFNMAHSHSLAIFGITRRGRIGVDVEVIRPIPDLSQLVSLVLSEREQVQWRRLPRAQRLQFFFDCWTRKEAFLKGVGHGLRKLANEIEAPLRQSQPVELFGVLDQGREVPKWTLRSLTRLDCAIAVAVKCQPDVISCWEWPQPEETMARELPALERWRDIPDVFPATAAIRKHRNQS